MKAKRVTRPSKQTLWTICPPSSAPSRSLSWCDFSDDLDLNLEKSFISVRYVHFMICVTWSQAPFHNKIMLQLFTSTKLYDKKERNEDGTPIKLIESLIPPLSQLVTGDYFTHPDVRTYTCLIYAMQAFCMHKCLSRPLATSCFFNFPRFQQKIIGSMMCAIDVVQFLGPLADRLKDPSLKSLLNKYCRALGCDFLYFHYLILRIAACLL